MATARDEGFMRLALEVCRMGAADGQSPFGACLVRGEEVLALAHNAVWSELDPTAHAEMRAIREAARVIGSIDLSGTTIYSTTEPCPMCFSAIHWARIPRIVFGASIADAARAGFNELPVSNRKLARDARLRVEIVPGVLAAEVVEIFRRWQSDSEHRAY